MRHFEEELELLQERLLQMAGLVESSIAAAVRSLVDRDQAYIDRVLENEGRINRLEIEVDDQATRLFARNQPMARDMRFLTAAIKINSDLERMGDLAVNVAQRSQSLMRAPVDRPLVDIPHMAQVAESMVRNALDSFVRRDPQLARKVLVCDDELDDLKDSAYTELIRSMEANRSAVSCSVDLMFVAHNLERIGDHATNIAEDVLFLVSGIDVRHRAETAQP